MLLCMGLPISFVNTTQITPNTTVHKYGCNCKHDGDRRKTYFLEVSEVVVEDYDNIKGKTIFFYIKISIICKAHFHTGDLYRVPLLRHAKRKTFLANFDKTTDVPTLV